LACDTNPDPICGISVHAYEDDDQRLATAMQVSRRLKKPLFVGEFGATGATPEEAPKFHRLLDGIVEHEVPLAVLWVFDLAQQEDFNIRADNARAWQLDAIAEANQKLQWLGDRR
jgi:hypothetical protein